MCKIGIVIINYKTDHRVLYILSNIANWQIELKDVKVVMHFHCVDDKSRKAIENEIKKYHKYFEIYYEFYPTHCGFAQSFNKAIRQFSAEYEFIVRLDNDLFLEKYAMKQMIEYLNDNIDIGIIGPRILSGYKPNIINGAAVKINWLGLKNRIIDSDVPMDADTLLGACMVFRNYLIQRIGRVFNEDYMLVAEEGEICQEVKKLGYRVVYYPSAKGWHFYGKSTGKLSKLLTYLDVRNNILFHMKYSKYKILFLMIYSLLTIKRFLSSLEPVYLIGFIDGLFKRNINKKLLNKYQ